MPHNPLAVVLDMVQAIERANKLTVGLSDAEFLTDDRAQWAVYSQIVILGEAASRLPREFCDNHPYNLKVYTHFPVHRLIFPLCPDPRYPGSPHARGRTPRLSSNSAHRGEHRAMP
jgi:hypothetical protein